MQFAQADIGRYFLLFAKFCTCERKFYLMIRSTLRHSDLEGRIFNLVISDISVVSRETTLTIYDYIETGSPVESKLVRVVALSITEITEIKRLENNRDNTIKKTDLQSRIP